MLELITWLSFILIFYGYFGYPLLLLLLPSKKKDSTLTDPPKSFTIIIAARNEEKVIQERIENILAAEIPPGSTVEYIVCSDASDDQTHEIVKSFENKGVKLIASEERRGKEYAQVLAIKAATGEILVFTDSKVWTEKNLILNLQAHFRDPQVGAVSSIDRVIAPEGGGSGEGMYVRYEMWLRKLEDKFQTLVGLSGSCFAVRRQAAHDLRSDIPSDFSLLIQCVKLSLVGILAEDVLCTYNAVKTEEQEFARKVRTVLRGITTLFAVREVMNPSNYGSFAWQIISHKLGRWLVPWFLIIGSLGAFKLAAVSLFWLLVSLGLLVFYGLAIYGYLHPPGRKDPWIKIPLFFLTTNAAIFVAWIKFLRGSKAVLWNPSVR